MKSKYNKLNLILLNIFTMIIISTILSGDLNRMTLDIKDIYIYYYSHTFLGEKITTINILSSSLPIIVAISIFADDLVFELERNAAYIFTRSRKRKRWITYKLMHIFIGVVKIQFIQFCVSFVYFRLMGYRINDPIELLLIVIQLFILNISTQYILILIANLVTLKTNSIYGYIICNFMFLISVITFNLLYFRERTIVKYIPFTQYILSVQENVLINRNIRSLSNFIPGYNFTGAIVYNFIVILLLLLTARKIIEKHEFY